MTEPAAQPGAPPAATVPSAPLAPEPAPVIAEPVAAPPPPIAVTQQGTEAPSLLPSWWPWLLVAVLAGVGLAFVLQRRRQLAPAGHEFERSAHEPEIPAPAAPPPPPPPLPAPSPPALPTGLVTTRLRAASPPPPSAAPAPVQGGVVSSRLRAWVELNLVLREILFDAEQAILRLDLVVGNAGTAAARDIALEAVTTNAGEEQGAELARFFGRPAPSAVAIPELGPLQDMVISHELKLPRGAIRAYEAQGRTLFVPVVALNAAYRTATGEGRTGAAFLVGRDMPGSDKLAPLLLPEGPGRLLGLGVRRLDDAIRR